DELAGGVQEVRALQALAAGQGVAGAVGADAVGGGQERVAADQGAAAEPGAAEGLDEEVADAGELLGLQGVGDARGALPGLRLRRKGREGRREGEEDDELGKEPHDTSSAPVAGGRSSVDDRPRSGKMQTLRRGSPKPAYGQGKLAASITGPK